MSDRALMLVRLRSRQPDGQLVGEAQRTCHLVPVPDSRTMPDSLVAYCGLCIGPGAAEILPAAVGMPCEVCMARSSSLALGMITQFGRRLERGGGEEVGDWS